MLSLFSGTSEAFTRSYVSASTYFLLDKNIFTFRIKRETSDASQNYNFFLDIVFSLTSLLGQTIVLTLVEQVQQEQGDGQK